MTRQRVFARRSTDPLVWCFAIACAFLTVAVIITGTVVLAVYLAYRPKMPYIRVRETHLDVLSFDLSGQLSVRMTITMEADNNNTKADASFSDIDFRVQFDGIPLAFLKAEPFNVGKNSTVLLPYVVESAVVPLDPSRMDKMDQALKQGIVEFQLNGQARTRWRVGIFVSVRFWTHLDCNLRYFYSNFSSVDLDCTSKSH